MSWKTHLATGIMASAGLFVVGMVEYIVFETEGGLLAAALIPATLAFILGLGWCIHYATGGSDFWDEIRDIFGR